MTTFRYKPDKIKHLTTINTLDTLHRKRVLEFESRRKRCADIRSEISKLESDQSQMEKPIERGEKGETNTVIDIKQRSYIKSQIQKLKQDLYDIENNISELEYYSQTNDILLDYYHEEFPNNSTMGDNGDYSEAYEQQQEMREMQELTEDSMNDTEQSEMDNASKDRGGKLKLEELNYRSQQKRKPKKVTKRRARKNDLQNKKSILDFFSDKAADEGTEEETKEPESKEEQKESVCIEQEVTNKATLFDYYMTLIDKTYIAKNKRNSLRICTKCNIEKMLMRSDGFYVCQECGEVDNAIIESEIPSHKDSVVEKHNFPYKRSNHLSECNFGPVLCNLFLQQALLILINI
ncbi:MAG: late transcription factor VLTF3-like protein [Harvfovirus sp.]|uniref:Late transcription factor VLTF3-like protein n=1 Tax=Harvfovirus sp. TaxID=2487768 RepID=A0A3G5A148_9VIRU|nr:MAG: late transcription factor VLTF3-like protein [Harvfovirus sp.]